MRVDGPAGHGELHGDLRVVELQVWDPNGWQMIATNAPWLEGDRYQQIVTHVNLNNRNTVYVQAIFSTNGASQYVRIDEMELECS